jgi:hypothetical protein
MSEIHTNDDFLNGEIPSFKEIDSKSSIKTNILLLATNWKLLIPFLDNLMGYIMYLRSLINIDNLIQEVTLNFQNSKIAIPIYFSMIIGEHASHNINNVMFRVSRVSQYIIEISNLTTPDWNVDRLLVQIKNDEGAIVYPLILTKNNKISIHFIDGLSTNYTVFFI